VLSLACHVFSLLLPLWLAFSLLSLPFNFLRLTAFDAFGRLIQKKETRNPLSGKASYFAALLIVSVRPTV
jgi:hypothetical protein